jgi:ribose-phosphate pyrophosphokinase
MDVRAPLCLVACDDAQDLAEAVGRRLGVEVTPSRDVWFASGEGKHVVERNVRGADLYVFARAAAPASGRSVYDNLMMALHTVDAARLADADRVTLVMPYLPGTRQDKRKDHTREGVSTGLFARMIMAAGASMVITVEPHNEAIVGCFDPHRTVLESLSICRPFAKYLSAEGLVGDLVASPDVGGLANARLYAQYLHKDIAALSKERDYTKTSVVTRTTVLGDVADHDVLLVDDIIDTGGSVVSAVEALWNRGARGVIVAAAHPILSGGAWERMADLHDAAAMKGVRFALVGTSSVLHRDPPAWYKSFALDSLLADVIRSVNRRGSVRALETE